METLPELQPKATAQEWFLWGIFGDYPPEAVLRAQTDQDIMNAMPRWDMRIRRNTAYLY